MAISTKPGAGVPIFDVSAHPDKMDDVIERQGQWCRILKAMKCPKLGLGRQHSMYCDICGGKAEIYEYQQRRRIPQEDLHLSTRNDGVGHLLPWWNPIIAVSKVWRHIHTIQGGSQFWEVDSFTDTEITLKPDANGEFPRYYERVILDYEVNQYRPITAEQIMSDGTSTVMVQAGLEIATQTTSNPEGVHGDLTSVSRVHNVTQSWTYVVNGFSRQAIYLNTTQIGYLAPAVDDVIEVDYIYCPPARVAIEMYEDMEKMEKMGHDMKVGDIIGTFPSYFDLGANDLVTFLFAQSRAEAVMTRGVAAWDELPAFDVVRTVDLEIRDEDGAFYTEGTHYEIRNYNDLYWISGGPAQGKKYSVDYMERPTFRIFERGPVHNFAENKRFPQKCTLRRYHHSTKIDRMRVDK
jgi:hypothetical protein